MSQESSQESKLKRKGLHKYFHVSLTDFYISLIISFGLFLLVIFKFMNRILDLGVSTSYISWIDAMQLALLWGVFAFSSRIYYDRYEKKYDQ